MKQYAIGLRTFPGDKQPDFGLEKKCIVLPIKNEIWNYRYFD